MRKILSLCMCLCAAGMLFAQTQKVTGSVLDAKTGEVLIGVSVLEVGTTNGNITDLDGNFSLSVQPGAKLQLSYVGYQTTEITAKNGNVGVIRLEPEAVALEDVTITGQMARTQQTPVAVSQITALEIEERLAGQEFPEVLKNTPGVHANGQGGGWGTPHLRMHIGQTKAKYPNCLATRNFRNFTAGTDPSGYFPPLAEIPMALRKKMKREGHS